MIAAKTGNRPEIAFAGRSNVGKSSFLNKMVGRKSLAAASANLVLLIMFFAPLI